MLSLNFFLYGFLAGCAGLLAQIMLLVFTDESFDVLNPSLLLIVIAAFLEEAVKLLFLFQAIRRFTLPALTYPHLIIFGVGFALLEFAFAFFMHPTDLPPLPLLALNALFHLATVMFLGWGLRTFALSRTNLGLLLLVATLFHTVYNLFRS